MDSGGCPRLRQTPPWGRSNLTHPTRLEIEPAQGLAELLSAVGQRVDGSLLAGRGLPQLA